MALFRPKTLSIDIAADSDCKQLEMIRNNYVQVLDDDLDLRCYIYPEMVWATNLEFSINKYAYQLFECLVGCYYKLYKIYEYIFTPDSSSAG